MPVLVTSKFDKDPIKNEQASLETPFSHYVYGKFFRRSRAPNSVGLIWPKFKFIQDFMPALVICKFGKKKLINNNRDKVETSLSVAMETRVLIQSVPKPYAAFPPPQ